MYPLRYLWYDDLSGDGVQDNPVPEQNGLFNICTQQTRDIQPMLVQCWASVADAGPTLNRRRLTVSYLLGGDVEPTLVQ